jgi:hypothetical protein
MFRFKYIVRRIRPSLNFRDIVGVATTYWSDSAIEAARDFRQNRYVGENDLILVTWVDDGQSVYARTYRTDGEHDVYGVPA